MADTSVFLILVGVIVAFLVIRDQQRKRPYAEKFARLMAKYGDEHLVSKLMNREFWQGITEEQLLDSLGEPIERDEKTTKAKLQETLKYDQTSEYRFGTRIFVENGIVVGWDLKGGQTSSGTPSEAYEVQRPEPSPREFTDFIGDNEEASRLEDLITEAREHKKPLSHLLLVGTPGFSGSTVARIVALNLNANYHESASAASVKRADDLAKLLTNLEECDVLFIDDIHLLKPDVAGLLCQAMKDFQLDLIIGEGPAARSVTVDLAKFTLIGASSAERRISAEVRDQFTVRIWSDDFLEYQRLVDRAQNSRQ
jgi:hypothetical protein